METAEIHYAWGEREERLREGGDKPDRDALERIYTERHGTMEGYEEFVWRVEMLQAEAGAVAAGQAEGGG